MRSSYGTGHVVAIALSIVVLATVIVLALADQAADAPVPMTPATADTAVTFVEAP